MNGRINLILPVILTIGLLVNGCGSVIDREVDDTAPDVGTGVGDMAPDFQLQSLDGHSYTLSDLQGQPVMLNFWATWCVYCLYEMPYIQQVYDEWRGRGLVLLAVNVGESSSYVSGFIQSYGYSFPVLLDTNGSIAQHYRINGWPTTFFIDMYGVIQSKVVGAFPNTAMIEQHLVKIVQ